MSLKHNSTPNNISELELNQVFVFGSNSAGHHYGGAAKLAHEKFGAEWGVGEGKTGNCYAFPTLTENMQQRPIRALEFSAYRLKLEASHNPDKTYLLTRVGTGIAGFEESEMAKLFADSPENITKPPGW